MEINQEIQVSEVFAKNLQAFEDRWKIIVNQGGTRSGKTYSICQVLIAIAQKEKLEISITSLSFPHLRKGAMKDWREIMENNDWYSQPDHIRTENKYKYKSGGYIEFFSIDDHLKVRGPGRDILFINEANLVDFETFTQLILRTRVCVFLDYNPADEFHWLYDKVLTRPDCKFIKSTYLDNPFLKETQVKEIENLRNLDENYWRIYGEGERGHSEGVIFTNWETYNVTPPGQSYYGLDFGFNHPAALSKCTNADAGLYFEELIHQSQLTNPELISLLKANLPPHSTIYCDPSRPDIIAEINKAGFRAIPANNDVKAGLIFMKGKKLFIHAKSVNLLKEIKSYKFLQKANKDMLPLKINDDGMDSCRYATTPIRQGTKQSFPSFIK